MIEKHICDKCQKQIKFRQPIYTVYYGTVAAGGAVNIYGNTQELCEKCFLKEGVMDNEEDAKIIKDLMAKGYSEAAIRRAMAECDEDAAARAAASEDE